MIKKLTIFFLGLLLLSLTSAITFEEEAVTDVIVPQYNQPAEILLKISDVPDGRYNLYTLADVSITPSEHFTISGEEKELNVNIFPMSSLNTRGFYTFVYYLRDFDGINHGDKMTIKVVDLRDLVEISSDANYPGDEMKFFVKNNENARLTNLTVLFSSVFFETEKTFDLEPLETKTFIVSVDREKIKTIPAGLYLLEAKFNVDRGEGIVKGKIYFGESKEIDTESKKEGFLIRTESIIKTNNGNTIETIKIEIRRNLLLSSFTFFSDKPEGVERHGLVNSYYWIRQINPSDSTQISARTNYIVPLLILIILAGAIVVFRKFNSTRIEIKKSVSHVKTRGGEFALRVRVNVKAHRSLENVYITEKVPAIVKVHENFGAMKPTSINLNDRKLQWSLGNLQAGEERAFSYVVYSKVGVVGKFSLPESMAVFEEGGEIYQTFSNKVFFLSEQVKKLD